MHVTLLRICKKETVNWTGFQTSKRFPWIEVTYLNAAESVLFFLTKAILTRPSHSWNQQFQILESNIKLLQARIVTTDNVRTILDTKENPSWKCLSKQHKTSPVLDKAIQKEEKILCLQNPLNCTFSCLGAIGEILHAEKADTWRKSG